MNYDGFASSYDKFAFNYEENFRSQIDRAIYYQRAPICPAVTTGALIIISKIMPNQI